VKLRTELGSPASPKGGTTEKPLPEGLNEADVITQLQLYASTVRAIDARARQLNGFTMNAEHVPYASLRWNSKKQPGETAQQVQQRNVDNQNQLKKKFQINLPLVNMPQALEDLTNTYQDVRSFAQRHPRSRLGLLWCDYRLSAADFVRPFSRLRKNSVQGGYSEADMKLK
jgi:hypothetical protein